MNLADEQLRLSHQGRATGALLAPTEKVRANRVVLLRRWVVEDERRFSKPVMRSHDGEDIREVATIFAVEDRVIKNLTLADAKACGYRTTEDLRAAWWAEHRRLPEAILVTFRIGDHLDRFRGLRAQMGSKSDYTSVPSLAVRNEGEALHPEEYAALGMASRQVTAKRKANTAASLASQPLAERFRAIEAAGERMREDIRSELFIASQQATKALRDLRAA